MLNISKLKETKIKRDIINSEGELFHEKKYYPASTKEWYNSIYHFNKNNEKNVPSLDVTTLKIIKNYFYMFSSRLEKSVLIHKIPFRKRKLNLNKVLVGKPEFKHTNDKVIITLYIYNRELSSLKLKLKKVRRKLLSEYFYNILADSKLTMDKILYAKFLTNKVLLLSKKIKLLRSKRKNIYNDKYTNNNIKVKLFYLKYAKSVMYIYSMWPSLKRYYNILVMAGLKQVGKSISIFEKNSNIKKSIKITKTLEFFSDILNVKYFNKYLDKYKDTNNLPKIELNKFTLLTILKKMLFRMRLYVRYNRILKFNLFKFNIFITPLKIFLENVYSKKVEFNIISLKNYHLDGHLLTQVMATKLKNRKNRLPAVISRILSVIKLPISRKHEYSRDKYREKYIQNIVIRNYLNKNFVLNNPNVNINSLIKHIEDKRSDVIVNQSTLTALKADNLNNIINTTHITSNTFKKDITKIILRRNLQNIVLDTIKNKSIIGIRIESSGRLTKRITAARSLFNISYKGTIKNINSSYKKIPSILLRGNLKSNLQFVKASNTTRIGAFGLKGWINSV